MTTNRLWLLVLSFLVYVSGCATGKDDAKKTTHFTIGKDTTYVTGPVDADGYIDYAAALNKRARQGVTPDNNANVLLWKAFGSHPQRANMPKEYFQWLQIKAPPERGQYFIDLSGFLKEKLHIDSREKVDAISNELYRCSLRPWKPKEHPQIAAWLTANEKPLALVIEASKRSRYFNPLVTRKTKEGSSGLIGALVPSVQVCRDLANILAARAMLNVAQGHADKAWQDLLTCHRLAWLVAQGSTLIEGLVGFAAEAVAGQADLAFLEGAGLTAKQIARCLGDLQELPRMPAIADKVSLCERFSFLDVVMMVDRGGIPALEALSSSKQPQKADWQGKGLVETIQWDAALRKANASYDRLAAAMRIKDRAARHKKLMQMEDELKAMKRNIVTSGQLAQVLAAKDEGKAQAKVIGDILICLLMPAIAKVQDAADRTQQNQNNLRIAFALAAYRAEQGRYPQTLDALVPKYLANIPPDLFSGKALVYRPSAKGYLLYSVGINGQDEQGRGPEDEPRGDDLSVQVPLRPLQEK